MNGIEAYDVNNVVQDNQGFLWLTTNMGLVKYNGYESKLYKPILGDSTSINSDKVESLYIDYIGDLWVGTFTGINRYEIDCDCFFRYQNTPDTPTPTGQISSIIEDKNDNLWVAINDGGLYRYDRDNDSFTSFLDNPNDSVTITNNIVNVLLADSDNNIWIGTGSGYPQNGTGLIKFNPNTGVTKRYVHDPKNSNSLIDNRVTALYQDQQGRILVGTYKSGLHIYNSKIDAFDRIEYDPKQPNKLHAPYSEEVIQGSNPFVKIITQDKNGGYWISTLGAGINYFDPVTNKVTFYSHILDNQNTIGKNVIWSLFEDMHGNIWVGSYGGGLYRKDTSARKFSFTYEFGNTETVYESLLNPETLWVLSQGQGLWKKNLKTGKTIQFLPEINNLTSIGHNWIRTAYQENKNTLWFGLGTGGDPAGGGQAGTGGLGRIDIETGTFKQFNIKRKNDPDDFSYTVFNICEDQEGYLWLGTGVGGLFKSNKNKTEFYPVDFPSSDSPDKNVLVFMVNISSDGTLWASDFNGDGFLYKYNREENKFDSFLKGFKTTFIVDGEKGWIWVSTWEKGILHINVADGSYEQFTEDNGLLSNYGAHFIKGDANYDWITTRNGPSKMNTKTREITPVQFPINTGRFHLGIFKRSDNQIFLGTNNGLLSFYPEEINGNPIPPEIVINNLLISGKSYNGKINPSKEIVLSYNENDISFKYIGLHFTDSPKNKYQYKLEPFDDDWINANYERTARYANLNPGKYTFKVKAANSNGIWSKVDASIQFTIKQAWWKTWWAYLTYILFCTILTIWFYRFQLSKKIAVVESERLKELNKLKNSLYTNITHEFRTPLTVIQGMTDVIKYDIKNKTFDKTEKSLDMIHRNSDNLLHLVNEMLDLAKAESGNLELKLTQANIIPFIKYLTESFSSMANDKNINLTVYSEIDDLVMDFDSGKLTSIITNLLSNSIKFTPKLGQIVVHLNKTIINENDYLSIKVKDKGVGISKNDLDKIFNRFYQVDSSMSRKHEGTGIGLTLTKELVELMGGTITVESTPEKGSTFIVQLPVTHNATLTDDKQLEFPKSKINATSFTSEILNEKENNDLPLVLLIEDNIDVAYYIKNCLEEKYQILHAVDGTEGIELARKKIPDLIITDVMMPGKNGFEVCEILKTEELTDHIPIIMLTAKATVKDRLLGLSFGADAYLSKPFIKAELLTRIEQLILMRQKLIRKFENTSFSQLTQNRKIDPETKFIQKVIEHIHKKISDESFGPSQLAMDLHLSESQVYRKLKAISGKSTAIFIRSVRLQKAKNLLLATDLSISEIAYDVGFNNLAWFSRIFKQEFGVSPTSIRK